MHMNSPFIPFTNPTKNQPWPLLVHYTTLLSSLKVLSMTSIDKGFCLEKLETSIAISYQYLVIAVYLNTYQNAIEQCHNISTVFFISSHHRFFFLICIPSQFTGYQAGFVYMTPRGHGFDTRLQWTEQPYNIPRDITDINSARQKA